MKRLNLIFLTIFFTSACFVAYGAASPASNHDPAPTSYGATILDSGLSEATAPEPPMRAKPEVIEAAVLNADIEEAVELEMPEAEKPVIALTFDDGPSRQITPQIVEVLEEYGAKATFCVVGNRLQKNMDIGELIFESGSELIGHSWDHSYLTKLGTSSVEKQLLDTSALIEEITGAVPVFHRPPYGAVNSRVRNVSEGLGMSLLMWSVDPKDWKTRDAEITYEHILENVTEGCIILCHDLYESTLELVKMLVPELLDRGYRFVTISELFSETEIVPGKVYTSVK